MPVTIVRYFSADIFEILSTSDSSHIGAFIGREIVYCSPFFNGYEDVWGGFFFKEFKLHDNEMVMNRQSKVNGRVFRGVLNESEWNEAGIQFMNGETMVSIAQRLGVSPSTVRARACSGQWRERKIALRLGIQFNPDGVGSVPVSHTGGNQVDEFDEARTLRGRHGKLYYSQLNKLREQIDHIDALVLKCEDAMQLDQLTKSLDRLNERYRIIQGISGPAVLKGEKERKIKSAPILPLDG